MPPDATDALVIGFGNVLWADEGFGVRTVEAFNEAFQGHAGASVVEGRTQGLSLLEHVCAAHGAPRWRRCTRTSTPRSGSDPTRARWQSGRQ